MANQNEVEYIRVKIQLKGDLEDSYHALKHYLNGTNDAEIIKFALRKAAKSIEKVFGGINATRPYVDTEPPAIRYN